MRTVPGSVEVIKMQSLKRISRQPEGFSLIEVLISMILMSLCLVGLAQMFTLSLMKNARSNTLTSAVFLAQQQIDELRTLPGNDLNTWAGSSPVDESSIDINGDGIVEFRRITQVQGTGTSWQVRVLIFGDDSLAKGVDTLLGDPVAHRVRADMNTIVSR